MSPTLRGAIWIWKKIPKHCYRDELIYRLSLQSQSVLKDSTFHSRNSVTLKTRSRKRQFAHRISDTLKHLAMEFLQFHAWAQTKVKWLRSFSFKAVISWFFFNDESYIVIKLEVFLKLRNVRVSLMPFSRRSMCNMTKVIPVIWRLNSPTN